MVFCPAGCATPTPYQPSTDGYGYSDQQIETDRYLIGFAGDDATPRSVVETCSSTAPPR